MELDENPVMSPSDRLKPIGPTILVVAASNASRTADALESAGECVSRAVIPGWRCIKPKIPAMVGEEQAGRVQGGHRCHSAAFRQQLLLGTD